MGRVSSANEEAIEAWNGVLFDRFLQYRDILVRGLGAHSDRALREFPPRAGDRVLDMGCGFGDTTQQLGELVGSEGEAVGIDAAPRFIEMARDEARRAGLDNVSFEVADIEAAELERGFDYAFGRMGTMFFANPVAAHRNVRRALEPGGRLCTVVWRRKLDNEWLYRAEQVVQEFVTEPEESDEPTCGPGPFALADADTTSEILLSAGFGDVALRRCDLPFRIGRDLDRAVELVMALGPAGEVIRLAGEEAERIRPEIEAAVRSVLADFDGPDGVVSRASTWIVTATVAN
ncbi:MAG: class I SAM-dependent methyltransferase [Actinomycetota bacterium]|nr:class I SAM-dependent methyltransferase [Actinomycetota bacterium]